MPKPKVSTKSKVDKEKVNQIKNSAERKQIVKEAKVKAVQNRNARQFAPIEEEIPTITPFDVAKAEQMNNAINLKLLGTDSAKFVDEMAKAQRALDENRQRVQNTEPIRVDALKGYGYGDSISTIADNSFVPTLDKRYQVADLGDPKLPKTTHQATDQLFTEHPKFSSDKELIDYYESIPNYNPFQRWFKKYEHDENGNLVDMDERTNTKQALNAQYNQAINRRNLQTLYNAGLTDEDILYFNNAILRSPKGTKEKDILSDPRMLAIDSKIKASGLTDKEWSEVFEEYEQPYMKEFIKEHPVTAYLARTGANPVESISNVASNTGNYFTGNPLEQGRNTAGLVDSTLTEDMGTLGKIGYNVLASISDMGTAMALSGGFVPFSASLMGVEKASDTMNDAIERGLNPNQIMAESVASGVTTALTEAIPMNKWEEIARKGLTTSIKDGVKFLKELSTVIAAGSFPEATQEGLEDIADTLADAYIAGDKSRINLQIAELEASGMKRGEAARKVWLNWLIDTGLDALAGGISGGLMTTGNITLGNLYKPDIHTPTETDLNPLAEQNLVNDVENALANEKITSSDVNNLGLDNSTENTYAQDTKGADAYGRADNENNVGRTDGRTQRTGEGYSETYDSEGRDARGNQRVFRQSVINDDVKASYVRAGADTQNFVNVSDRLDEFSERLEQARQTNKYGLMVSAKKPQDMIDSGALVFMSENGNSGALVTADGDIEAVFHINKDGLSKTSYQTIVTAIQNGGTKLDCFGKNLVNIYNALGFEAVSMTPWDEAQAPDGWTYGEKDVYAMKLRDGVTAEDVIANLGVPEADGGFHLQTEEELKALRNFDNPKTGYDEAMAYRDSLIKTTNSTPAPSNNQNNVPTMEQSNRTASFNSVQNAEVPRVENVETENTESPRVDEEQSDDEWNNRNRKAVKKNKDEVAVTQYVRNTLYDLPSVKANKDVQQYLLNEEAKGTMGAKIVHNEDSVRAAKAMIAAAKAVDGNVDGVINKLINSEHTISEFGAQEQDELQLALDIKLNEAHKSGNFKGIRKMIRGALLKERSIAQAMQALAKYSHTASSAITKAESLIHGITEAYKNNPLTKRRAELNSKLAKALVQMGDDTKAEAKIKTPKTHEEIVESVRNTLETEYSSISRKFTDADVEFIASMLEADTPVNTIQDELEHWFKHGKWYTLDESIEIKPETFKKLDKILAESGNKMADVKKEVEPLSQSRMREQIRMSLAQEFSSISDKFTEKDIDFIINMFEENIPKWQIRDEIEHFIREGEWYTLDESIENPKPMSKEISRALDIAINGTPEEKAKAKKTVSQIEEEIRNRLDEEPAKIRNKFNDTDIKFLANRILRGEDAEVINDMINRKLKTGYFEISDEDLNFVVETYDAVNSGKLSSKEEYFLMQQANARLAKYLGKGTLMERLNQWRYLMMLHAPSTHLTNVQSNTFWGTVSMFKDTLAAAGEAAYSRTKNGKDFERTKAIITHKDGELVKAGWKDFADWAWAEYARGGSKYNDRSEIKQAQQIGSKGVNKAAEINSNLLEAEDILAGRIKYSQALAGYLKGNGKNESIFTSRDVKDRALLERARNYALEEAKKATHHEDNKLAAALTRASRSTQEGGILLANFAIESLMPFKRTTSNIGRKFMVEYNPLVQGANAVRLTYQAIANDGDVAETIDSYAKTLTGAGLVRLGWWLASKGLLVARRDDDDKDDVLKKAKNYAITWIDSKGNQHYVTIDRLAPTAMLVCVGAELFEDGGMSADAFWGMFDSFMENTLLSGFNGLIDEIERASWDKEKHKGFTIGAKLLNSYFSQYIPTTAGKLARTIDPTSRDTYYTGYKGDKDTLAKYGRQFVNKIPFASFSLEPRVNVYGEEEKNVGGNFFGRLAYNFLATWQYSKRERDDIQNKIAELDAFSQTLNGTSRATMEKQLNDLLDDPLSSFDGEKLSPEEYTKLRKATGESAVELFSALVNADDFNALTPEAQAQLMDEMGLFARALGKRKALGLDAKTYAQKFADYEHGADAVVNGMIKKYLLDSGGIQSNSAAGKELLQLDNLSADDIAKVTGITAEETLASQQKIADEIPTLDTSLIMSSNGSWVNPETAIPYLDSLGLDDATQGEILYNNGKRSQKEIDAFNDMGGYEGVKRYYDIKEYGMTHNTSSVTKDETIVYLESLGLTADEINDWLSVYGWKPDYTG